MASYGVENVSSSIWRNSSLQTSACIKHIPESVIRQKLSVIDWGCGQGLAPIVFNEFINDITQSYGSITDITLIEPSGCCLNQAYAFIEWSIPDVMISTIMKEEVDIQPKEICVQENTIIHLLSNIVDMPQFNGAGIRKYLKSASRCRNIIVIVSPFYQEEGRGKRMDIFVDTLKDFHKIYSFQKHKDDWKENYSCQIRILDNCRD